MDLTKVPKLLLENSFHGYIMLLKMMKLYNCCPWLPMDHGKSWIQVSQALYPWVKGDWTRSWGHYHFLIVNVKIYSEYEQSLAQIKEDKCITELVILNILKSFKDATFDLNIFHT